MYKIPIETKTDIRKNTSYEAKTLEQQIAGIMDKNELVPQFNPIYTEKKEGVNPAYDIRTDKMEYAIDQMERVAQQKNVFLKKKEEEEAAKAAEQKKENNQ